MSSVGLYKKLIHCATGRQHYKIGLAILEMLRKTRKFIKPSYISYIKHPTVTTGLSINSN